MITVNGREYKRSRDEIYVNGQRVKQVFADGKRVYPTNPSTSPSKIALLEYVVSSDHSDICVAGFNEDGSMWYHPDTQDGLIPRDELTIIVTSSRSTECGILPEDTHVTNGSDVHLGIPKSGHENDCFEPVAYAPIIFPPIKTSTFRTKVADGEYWGWCYGYYGSGIYALALEYDNYNPRWNTHDPTIVVGWFIPFECSNEVMNLENPAGFGRIQYPNGVANGSCIVDISSGKDGVWAGTIQGHSTVNRTRTMAGPPGAFAIGNKAVYCLYDESKIITGFTKEVHGDAYVYPGLSGDRYILYGVEPSRIEETLQGEPYLGWAFWNWYYGGPIDYEILRVSWRAPNQENLTCECSVELRGS